MLFSHASYIYEWTTPLLRLILSRRVGMAYSEFRINGVLSILKPKSHAAKHTRPFSLSLRSALLAEQNVVYSSFILFTLFNGLSESVSSVPFLLALLYPFSRRSTSPLSYVPFSFLRMSFFLALNFCSLGLFRF